MAIDRLDNSDLCGCTFGSLACLSFTAPDPYHNPCSSCVRWDCMASDLTDESMWEPDDNLPERVTEALEECEPHWLPVETHDDREVCFVTYYLSC